MKYDIWIEGYLTTGMEGIPAKARCLATGAEGDSFWDAVSKWYNSIPDVKHKYGELSFKGNDIALWGCRLFDNEEDARRSFG